MCGDTHSTTGCGVHASGSAVCNECGDASWAKMGVYRCAHAACKKKREEVERICKNSGFAEFYGNDCNYALCFKCHAIDLVESHLKKKLSEKVDEAFRAMLKEEVEGLTKAHECETDALLHGDRDSAHVDDIDRDAHHGAHDASHLHHIASHLHHIGGLLEHVHEHL